jgi:hypothetical protein
MDQKTVVFRIDLEHKRNVRVRMLHLEHLNKTYVDSILEKRHASKSESDFIELLQKAQMNEESKKNDFSRAYESLTKLGEIVEILPLDATYHALIETANSTRFCSVRSAEIRTLKQQLRLHQIRLESNAWYLQYYQEKLQNFEIARKRLKTFIKRGYF